MQSVREPAVAGTFYPDDPAALGTLVNSYLEGDAAVDACPKAIIAPHAGFIYSGPIAGRVYQQVAPARDRISRVVLLGPSHRVAFRGMAVPTSTAFRTPLGEIEIDSAGIQQIVDLPEVGFLDQAHADEHSLEVHLPFLQKVIPDFKLVPIVVGDVSKEEVALVLERLWGGPETLIVISSDLSHFESYEKAQHLDAHTSRKITSLDATLKGEEACGCRPVNGLLHYLKAHELSIDLVDLKNSGDTAGDRSRVVGYGAWRVAETDNKRKVLAGDEWSLSERQLMIQLAREAIRSPLEGEKNFHIDVNRFPESLKQERASFITLKIDGKLRGCIGSLTAHRPLILDIANNAQAAAFKDPRFNELSHQEYLATDIHVSILSKPWRVSVNSRSELLEKLQPGLHGLILREGNRQATYLPSVWEQIPQPEQFVGELRRKAGLAFDGWSDDMQVFCYTTEEFS
jgi:AmmeMemoRadiSam system protein B/AmmeMemoRadiSam system protein A